jgi:hypothetical protein
MGIWYKKYVICLCGGPLDLSGGFLFIQDIDHRARKSPPDFIGKAFSKKSDGWSSSLDTGQTEELLLVAKGPWSFHRYWAVNDLRDGTKHICVYLGQIKN